MTTTFLENDSFIYIKIIPTSVEDSALLLRMVKSSKKKKHRIAIGFSSELKASIIIEKMMSVKQNNSLSND